MDEETGQGRRGAAGRWYAACVQGRMGGTTLNRLLFTLGIVLASNGTLLALTPGRFVALRRASWLPDRVNSTLDRLASRAATGRATGAAAAAAGLALVLTALRRTKPESLLARP